ncbi:MAG: O-antigen ligase family protein [Spirochaetes bacterium]|nr:O-antigen ligase family protein [Spirochaetota bacterium]
MIAQKKSLFDIIVNKTIEWGLIIFAVGSPFSISLAQLGFITALIFWIVKLLFMKGIRLKGTFLDVFILILLAGFILSSIFSIQPVKSLRANHNVWLFSMLWLFFNNTDMDQAKKVLRILLITSILMGIYGLFQSVTGIDLWRNAVKPYGMHLYGAVGGFGLHLTYGGYQMMTALILLAISLFGLNEMKGSTKVLVIVSTVILILSVVASFARTAWMGLFAGMIFLGIAGFFTGARKTSWIILGALALIIILILSSWDMRQRFYQIFLDLKQSARTQLWGGSLEMIKDHPIFGVGSGMFKSHFLKYRPDYVGSYGHTHNDWLAIYLRGGLVGFAGFVLMYVFYFKNMIRCSIVAYKNDKLKFSLCLGFMAAIISFMVAGWGQNYFTDSENAMLFWFVMGISITFYYGTMKKNRLKSKA